MNLLNKKLPERILRQLGRRPMLFLSGLSLSLKVGKDAVDFKSGKINAGEFRQKTGGSVGGIGLGAAGSYAGLLAGHFIVPVPIVGGLLGGFAGGALGEMMGDHLGRKAVQKAEAALGYGPQPKTEGASAETASAEAASTEAASTEPAAPAPEASAQQASAPIAPQAPKAAPDDGLPPGAETPRRRL
jgi:pyruvate/2-oxoglutarate dehydrogenase complex dihydrolipoamide acyltransferase (E2) component